MAHLVFGQLEQVASFEQDLVRSTRLLAAGSSPMIDSAVTLLPEPDSPTIATVSRCPISNEIPFTTVVHSPSTRNAVVRLRTARTGN